MPSLHCMHCPQVIQLDMKNIRTSSLFGGAFILLLAHVDSSASNLGNAVETLSQKGFTLTRLILLRAAAAAEEIRHASL